MGINIRVSKGVDLNKIFFSDIAELADKTLLSKTGKTLRQTVETPYLRQAPCLRDYWHTCVADYIPDEGYDFGSFKEHLEDTLDSLEYSYGEGTKHSDLTADQWETMSERNFLYYLFIPVLEAIVDGLGENADTDFYVEYF